MGDLAIDDSDRIANERERKGQEDEREAYALRAEVADVLARRS